MSTQESDNTEAAQNKPLFTGSCFCNAISFTLSALPSNSYICHCLDCRRFSGSSFAHNAMFPRSALSISFGKPEEATFATPDGDGVQKRTYDSDPTNNTQGIKETSPEGKSPLSTFGNEENGTSQFCSICGTRLLLYCGTANVDMRDKVIVPVGAINGSHEDERLKPLAEGWCRRRESWMPSMNDTKNFEHW